MQERVHLLLDKLDKAALSGELDTVVAVNSWSRAAQEYHRLTQRTYSWQSAGKRGVHQPQVESLARLMIDKNLVWPKHDGGVLVELGAGKALLGQIVASLADAPLIVVDRRACDRSNYDERVGHSHVEPGVVDDADSTTRFTADVREVDIVNLLEVTSKDGSARGACVLAKHLCACGTDEAIRRFVEGVKRGSKTCTFHSMVVAPCCHPQITWEGFCGKEHFTTMGFSKDDLPLMLQLLDLSKTPILDVGAAAKWKCLRRLGADKIKQYGRRIRRVIERCRCIFIEQQTGFVSTIYEYVSSDVTPDNLVLVLEPPESQIRGKAVPQEETHVARNLQICHKDFPNIPKQGAILHVVTPPKDAPKMCSRIVTYLLECSANATLQNHLAAVDSAWVGFLKAEDGYRSVVVVSGDAHKLIKGLEADPIITAAIGRVVAFNKLARTKNELESQLQSMPSWSTGAKYRVVAWPSSCQDTFLSLLPREKTTIHDAKFTLNAMQWGSVGVSTSPFVWSEMSVESWKPQMWGKTTSVGARKTDGGAPEAESALGKSGIRKSAHLIECTTRLHVHKWLVAKQVLVLGVTDDQISAMKYWATQYDPSSIRVMRPRFNSVERSWGFSTLEGELIVLDHINQFDVVICQGEQGFKEDAQMLKYAVTSGLLRNGCNVIAQLRLGYFGKKDRSNAACAKTLQETGCFTEIKIHHLINERETDRTLLMSVGPKNDL